MREIKFRAFSVTEGMIYFTLDELIRNVINRQHLIDYPNLVKMQFTGLLDKNGVEIYEGDLIKQQDYEKPLEVYFCEDCAGFRARLKGYGNTELIQEDCEIIGNIYETKS